MTSIRPKPLTEAQLIADLTTAGELAELGKAKAEIDKNKAIRAAALKKRAADDAAKEKVHKEKVAQRQKEASGAQSVADLIPDGPDRVDPRNIQAPGAGAAGIQEAVAGGRAVQAGGQNFQAPANVVEGQVNTGGRTINTGSGVFLGTPTQETRVGVRQNALTPGDVLRARVTQEGQQARNEIDRRRLEFEKMAEADRLAAREREHDAEIAIQRERNKDLRDAKKVDTIIKLTSTGMVDPATATKAAEQGDQGNFVGMAETLGPSSDAYKQLRDREMEKAGAEVEALEALARARDAQAGANRALANKRMEAVIGGTFGVRTSIWGPSHLKPMTEGARLKAIERVLPPGVEDAELPQGWDALQSQLVPVGLDGDNPVLLVAHKAGWWPGSGSDSLQGHPLQDALDEVAEAEAAGRVSQNEQVILYDLGYRWRQGKLTPTNLSSAELNSEVIRALERARSNIARAQEESGNPRLTYAQYVEQIRGIRTNQVRQQMGDVQRDIQLQPVQ